LIAIFVASFFTQIILPYRTCENGVLTYFANGWIHREQLGGIICP